MDRPVPLGLQAILFWDSVVCRLCADSYGRIETARKFKTGNEWWGSLAQMSLIYCRKKAHKVTPPYHILSRPQYSL